MDGFDEVRDLETQDVVFSTKLDERLAELIGRPTMQEQVVDNVVNIWNKTGQAEGNLWSDGTLDEYLLNEGHCTQEERETIVESLYNYAVGPIKVGSKVKLINKMPTATWMDVSEADQDGLLEGEVYTVCEVDANGVKVEEGLIGLWIDIRCFAPA